MSETTVSSKTRGARLSGFARAGTLAALALLLSVAGSVSARGDLVTTLSATATEIDSGLFRYEYTLTNELSSTLSVTDFFLDVSPFADLQAITAPVGFIISYSAGDPDITFSSPEAAFDILPGSFGLFSFESLIGPKSAAFLVRGLGETSFGENSGFTLTPSAVPEPLSVGLFAMGSGMAGAWLRRRKVALPVVS